MNASIVLFGFKGCGKSYFGKLLSEVTGYSFIDTDQLIEAWYENESHKNETHEKCSCKEIVQKIGEDEFRALERKVISLLEQSQNRIIAVGGGTVLDAQNYQILKKLGKLVYLEVEKNILKKRILQQGIPSFLDAQNFNESFEKMYNERRPIYESISSLKIDIQEKNDQQVLLELLE